MLVQIYLHHELIIADYVVLEDVKNPLKRQIYNYKNRCLQIRELIRFTELSPLSVWTSEIEGVAEGVNSFAVANSSCFNDVMQLPHLKRLLFDADQRMRALQREANRQEAAFNRFVKLLR